MDLHLTGKVAVVTGAQQGHRPGDHQALAAEGVNVVAGARDHRRARSSPRHPGARRRGGPHQPRRPGRLIDEAVSRVRRPRHPGEQRRRGAPHLGGFLSVTDDDWLSALTVNFLAAVRTTRAALPHLLERGSAAPS